ncbi:fructose-bisphosphatase class I [Halobacteriales archaeon QH_6_68_27]|nr:MAG: fructose-bisphosphatase class I [Halobacteriales archaeon QH_6_68_27]
MRDASDGNDGPAWTGDPVVDRVCDILAGAAPEITRVLARRRAYIDRENPSGDRIRAADEFADTRLEEGLLAVGGVASYASEEREAAVPADEVGGPAGTAYPNTTMVVADGDRAAEYLLVEGEATALDDDLSIPEDPTVYGMGGRRPDWTERVREATEAMEADRLKLRYGGAFVADVTQVLVHGGLFAYPELRDNPEGKLRYHFECAPMGLVVTSAGGAATTGEGDWRSVDPTALHERSPIYLGTESLVADIEERFR